MRVLLHQLRTLGPRHLQSPREYTAVARAYYTIAGRVFTAATYLALVSIVVDHTLAEVGVVCNLTSDASRYLPRYTRTPGYHQHNKGHK